MAKRRDKKRKRAQQSASRKAATQPLVGAWLSPPPTRRRRIHFLVSNYSGTGWYRGRIPASALERQRYEVIVKHTMSPQDLEYYDVIVFQMSASPDIRQYMGRANDLGKTTVFEIDDDYWNMTPDNPVYEEWHKSNALIDLRECMKTCQIVTTTTPYLARILGRHHPNVKVLPNMLPDELWRVPRPNHGDKLIIGWAGGAAHWKDVELLAGTIEQILDDYPHVEFWACGMPQYPFRPHDRIKYTQFMDIDKLPAYLANYDIGLAPLVDSHFTRCKSDLKFLEYSRVGAAVIASPVEAYVHTLVDGKNGLFAGSTKEWMRQIRRLIEDAELRKRLATEGQKLAISRSIDKNIHLWEKAYGLK